MASCLPLSFLFLGLFRALTCGRVVSFPCGADVVRSATPGAFQGWAWHCPWKFARCSSERTGSFRANGTSDGRLLGSERLTGCAAPVLFGARPSLVLLDLPVHSTGRLRSCGFHCAGGMLLCVGPFLVRRIFCAWAYFCPALRAQGGPVAGGTTRDGPVRAIRRPPQGLRAASSAARPAPRGLPEERRRDPLPVRWEDARRGRQRLAAGRVVHVRGCADCAISAVSKSPWDARGVTERTAAEGRARASKTRRTPANNPAGRRP
jgi:hypothetical protein